MYVFRYECMTVPQLHNPTCSFSVHLDANNSKVGGAEAHTSIFLLPFGFCSSHLFNGVDTHDGHSIPRDNMVTQVPERKDIAKMFIFTILYFFLKFSLTTNFY